VARNDPAPSNGVTWDILPSSTGTPQSFRFGLQSDFLVPGDYDGDNKTDIGVVRQGAPGAALTWYTLQSSTGILRIESFGKAGDRIVPGDYDGDGKFEFAVQRNDGGGAARYWINRTTSGFNAVQWGMDGDDPVDFITVQSPPRRVPAVVRDDGTNLTWLVRRGVETGSDDDCVPADEVSWSVDGNIGTLSNTTGPTTTLSAQVPPGSAQEQGLVLASVAGQTGGAAGVTVNAGAEPSVAIGPDATDPTKNELRVVGTRANDVIDVRGRNAAVDVVINGAPFGRFSPAGRIVVSGLAGNDTIHVGGVVFPRRAWVDGGAGDDVITTGNGASLLVGGEGNDRLLGGRARDLIIGGTGADALFGQNGDDILVGGGTSFDANTAALDAIMAEWTSTRSYAERIGNLTGGGLIGGFDLKGGFSVSDDASADALTGGPAIDWFFAGLGDTTDARAFEIVSGL
jgi:Ca2+-binding RTX toxin-like protein